MRTMANWRNCILITSGTCLCWTVIDLLNVFANVSSSTYSIQSVQSHEGSAPTSEFSLTKSSPDARIIIGSSNQVVVIHVEPHSKAYKVSLELLAMQLCDGKGDDRLKVVFSDPTRINTEIWKMNVTPSDVNRKELKDIRANQIVLIPEGRWVLSGADLVATLYTDVDEGEDLCPENTFPCSCTSRCIPNTLTCNKNPNCGMCCSYDDESENVCPGSSPPTTNLLFSTIVTEKCEKPVISPTSTEKENDLGGTGSGNLVNASSLSVLNVLFMILISCVIFK